MMDAMSRTQWADLKAVHDNPNAVLQSDTATWRLFGLVCEQQVTCPTCKYESIKMEENLTLQLSVAERDITSLELALATYFSTVANHSCGKCQDVKACKVNDARTCPRGYVCHLTPC
jgi:hypothetical protein